MTIRTVSIKLFIFMLITIFLIPLLDVTVVNAWAPLIPYPGYYAPKWRDNQISNLRVYINDTDGTNPQIWRVTRRAMDYWNSFGIVRFVEVYSPSDANILVVPEPQYDCKATTLVLADSDRYIINVTIKYGKYSACPDFDWWVAAMTHELGHALGLSHSRGAPSIMGEAWDKYRINAPLYDDLIALWVLYRRGNLTPPVLINNTAGFSYIQGGPRELGGYPYRLIISMPGTNRFGFMGYNVSLPYFTYIVTGVAQTQTVYRGAIGIWNSTVATDQTQRVAIIELSGSGSDYYIALTYTSSSTGQTVMKLKGYTSPESLRETGFFIMLILYLDKDGNTRAMAMIYRGTDIEAYLPLTNAPVLYHNVLLTINPRYVGFAVWTDTANNPSSDYTFGPVWIIKG